MTAPEIVRRLAELDPGHEVNDGPRECFFCHRFLRHKHKPDCLWLLAKALDAGKEGT